jgi:hypothetical protein
MSAKTDLARQYHEQGYGCSQSVLATFAQEYGLRERFKSHVATILSMRRMLAM